MSRTTLRERFGAFFQEIHEKSPPVIERRGKARRIQLRVNDQLLVQLAVIKIAEGGSSNKFCEAAIAEAAAKRIGELRKAFTADTWETIVGAAHAEWRNAPDG